MSAGTTPTSTPIPPRDAVAPGASPAADLTCPRCGYDQSGLEQSLRWQCERGELDAWPLKSTCAECGREFDWRDFVDAELQPARFFETERRHTLRAFCRTVFRMPRAKRFWKWVQPEWPVRYGRMLFAVSFATVLWTSITTVLLAALFFSAWIVVAFLNSLLMGKPGVMFAESGIEPSRWPDAFKVGVPWASTWVGWGPTFDSRSDLVAWVLVLWGSALAMPVVLMVSPIRWRDSKPSAGQLSRIFAYGLPRLVIATMVGCALPRILLGETLPLGTPQAFQGGFTVGIHISDPICTFPVFCMFLFLNWRWWTCALRDHMTLQRPRSVAGTAIVVSFIVCWIVALIIPATRASVTLFD